MKKESKFQSDLKKKIEKRFKGSIVMKLNAGLYSGIPDLIVLYKNKWATLECKREADASKRPNQEYYRDKLNEMSFSRIIFPENEEEVLDELQQAFES